MSFIEVSPDSDFPLQNLPYGVFSTADNVSFAHCLAVIEEIGGVSIQSQSFACIYTCTAQLTDV